ncbi:uncharacterized protein LOC120007293 [Tripterygium wilfordii]|uniref:uncharacterized protein LOC120007293 n=1 Tax=Tripterygium wilfordii TaxID=458696 RepID=UPI0018F7F351|nr:uncharacterized protein LOC120007293 [Tripterygium wilfordii]
MASNLVQLQVPVLMKDNYGKWSTQFKALFGSQDLWDIVNNGYTEPTPKEERAYTAKQKSTLKEQRKKDKKALFLLYQGLDQDDTFEKISEATTSKEVWDNLAVIYKGVERVKKVRLQTLWGGFETVHMYEGETMTDYHSRMLRSLTSSFEHVVTAIAESRDLDKMSVEELLRSLRVHEAWFRKNVNTAAGGQALKVKFMPDKTSGGRGRGRGGSNSRGRGFRERNSQYGERKMQMQC